MPTLIVTPEGFYGLILGVVIGLMVGYFIGRMSSHGE